MLGYVYDTYDVLPFSVTLTLMGTVVVWLALYIHSLLQPIETYPELHYKDSALARHIVKNTIRLSQPYRLPAWAQSGNLQSILPGFLKGPEFKFEREYVQMKDRGLVALDWGISGIDALEKKSPVVLVLPGLTGDASGFNFLCARAIRKGFRPVVVNKRGHGNTPLRTPKFLSFGDPSDFRQVLKYVRGRYPQSRITAIGWSAGSGVVGSYLGEYGSASGLAAAVFNCPGYDGAALFGKYLRQPYNFVMLRNLKQIVRPHSNVLRQAIDIDKALKSSTCNDFDENFYCKIYGYSGVKEYWDINNPMRNLDRFRTPFLSINSNDDPVCVRAVVPRPLFKKYENFMLVTTDHGGHCGFMEYGSLNSWADKLALDYLITVLDYLDNHNDGVRAN